MIFKHYNSDHGFQYNGVNYDFPHCNGLEIEDPQFNRLTRGTNATDEEGIVYTEGGGEPKTMTVTILGMTADMKALLDRIYKNKERVDAVYCVDRTDGSKITGKSAILCQAPRQLSIAEDAESMNVVLVWQTFKLEETHKS